MKAISFNDEMVRAILSRRKTQTRRPVEGYGIEPPDLCPYGQVGDFLWVREAFCLEHQVEGDPPFDDGRPVFYLREGLPCAPKDAETWIQPHYRATDPAPELYYADLPADEPRVRWAPPQNMPRWASRITLKITDIRVQRVREITEEEARKEGIIDGGCVNCGNPEPCHCERPEPSPVDAFVNIWDSIYGEKGFGWEANPWVWAITFKKVG